MPTEVPTVLPTEVPSNPPANPPNRTKLRPPLMSKIGDAMDDDTKIDVFDLPVRTKVLPSEISQNGGKRPQLHVYQEESEEPLSIPVYYGAETGLYFPNDEISPEPGTIIWCKGLSPCYTVKGRPIAGFMHVVPDDPET